MKYLIELNTNNECSLVYNEIRYPKTLKATIQEKPINEQITSLIDFLLHIKIESNADHKNPEQVIKDMEYLIRSTIRYYHKNQQLTKLELSLGDEMNIEIIPLPEEISI